MTLDEWLTKHKVKKSDFARRIGVSPAAVTGLLKGAWMKRGVAEAIARETKGKVTANDFLLPPAAPRPTSRSTRPRIGDGETVMATPDKIIEAQDAEIKTLFDLLAIANAMPLGSRVRKTRGSSWQGHVVGYYRTALTPNGVCVESEREIGSVQIYPVSALELVTTP